MSDFNINEDAQSGGECSGSQSSANNEPKSQNESAFPDEDEETITMMDVIEREDKLEEEASAVLGNSDEKNCTFPKGYVKRQALYSCATCFESSGKMAAICLACSLECHDNHELFELYTKRNYRCDCGNSRFKEGFECKLMDKQTKKAPVNENNKYNHNFIGKYCTCDKRYPPDENDTSAETNDEMYQCIVCEDWYHGKHLGVDKLPSKFDELICAGCVQKLEFIHFYRDTDSAETPTDIKSSSNDSVPAKSEVKPVDANESVPSSSKGDTSKPEPESAPTSATDAVSSRSDTEQKLDASSVAEPPPDVKPTVNESDTNDSQAENKDPTSSSDNSSHPVKQTDQTVPECVLAQLRCKYAASSTESDHPESQPKSEEKLMNSSNMASIFWSDCSWRSKLCKCPECITMYKKLECEYLLDEDDTVQYYEAQGKVLAKDRATPYERGMTALHSMGNRAAVVEALHGYDELKADLSTYLRKFADSNQVVKEADIHDFFAQLRSKKRPRLEYE